MVEWFQNKKTTANMYRLGWDERNGGNISYLLDEQEVYEYLDENNVIRTIPLGFDATPIIGKVFIVTGTGKYFKNVNDDPETNLGIVRIAGDGQTAELLWGYKDGGKFTSEFPAHLMSHMARLSVDPENRVVMHCHPTYTLAMNYAHILDEDRKVNAQRFEAGFYAKPNLRGLEQSFRTQTVQQPGVDIVQLLVQLQANPELAAVLKGLLNTNLFG